MDMEADSVADDENDESVVAQGSDTDSDEEPPESKKAKYSGAFKYKQSFPMIGPRLGTLLLLSLTISSHSGVHCAVRPWTAVIKE